MKRKHPFRVSVQDFGAKGDGFWDDTEAFESAKRCKADVIEIPRATYVVADHVKLDARFRPVPRRAAR